MGILRADRVSGLGGANAINGSVFFPYKTSGGYFHSHMEIMSDDFAIGTGNFTSECFYYQDGAGGHTDSGGNVIVLTGNKSGTNGIWLSHRNDGKFQANIHYASGSWNLQITSSNAFNTNQWYHVALVRSGSSVKLYVDGVQEASGTSSSDLTTSVSNGTWIGSQGNTTNPANLGSRGINGYVSNVRFSNEALYTAAFTAPTTRLEKLSSTLLLCCQSPGNILKEETGKIITTYGANIDTAPPPPIASRFAPDVGEDHGTTFTDNTRFDTLSYMVPPGGTTTQSNRGRGIFGGGYTSVPSGAAVKRIYYVQIQSMGTSAEFGDMYKAAAYGQGGCSSSTRGLFTGGTTPTNLQDIDYITIATTSNGLDFGNLRIQHGYTASCSNETRGLTGGGRGVGGNEEIDYVTIATTADGQDFGDLSGDRMGLGAFESSTRGYFAGGSSSPASPAVVYKNIDTVLFATLGSTSDFGDMTVDHDFLGTCSSSTRGIMYGGTISYGPTTRTSVIEYVTTSSTGSGTDFGDVRDDGEHVHGTSNSIRGVFAGGVEPYRNSIDFITISTTGNGQEWGDLPISSGSYGYAAGLSDSHGGIS